MKIRKSFVSNSSSTSFVCQSCGKFVEHAWDWEENAEALQCKKCFESKADPNMPAMQFEQLKDNITNLQTQIDTLAEKFDSLLTKLLCVLDKDKV